MGAIARRSDASAYGDAVQRLNIAVSGGIREASSLYSALRRAEWLPVTVRPTVGPTRTSDEATTQLSIALESPGDVRRLSRTLLAWLTAREGDRVLTISANAMTAEAETGITTDVLSALIRGVLLADEYVGSDPAFGLEFRELEAERIEAFVAREAAHESARQVKPPWRIIRQTHSGSAGDMTMAVSIYLSDEADHEHVEAAVEAHVVAAGLQIIDRDEPILGSWFRQMRAAVDKAVRTPAARESALIAAHIADTRLVLTQDAAVTATLMQNLGPVIASLQNTKDAVIRVGALLIVKVDWMVSVFQLTAAQQAVLDHRPRLAASPREIIDTLNGLVVNEDAPPAIQ